MLSGSVGIFNFGTGESDITPRIKIELECTSIWLKSAPRDADFDQIEYTSRQPVKVIFFFDFRMKGLFTISI